jgi:hypothetical protein
MFSDNIVISYVSLLVANRQEPVVTEPWSILDMSKIF